MRDTGVLPSDTGLPAHSMWGLFGVGSYIAQRDLPDVDTPVGSAQRLGATWVREEFTASALHSSSEGPYDWRPYDRVVNAERKAGLHVLGLLDYSNTWGLADHGTMPHGAIEQLAADYADFAYATAHHFRGRVQYWQVWNEPNIQTFWHPQPSAADYAVLLESAYRAIKRADPSARVVLAGTSGVDTDFLRSVASYTDSFDVVAVHPYRSQPESDLVQQVTALRAFGKPVWFTEIGWPAGADCAVCTNVDDQANYLVRFYALAAAAGVQRIFWYDLRDDHTGVAPEETHFGLLRRDFSGKPAARTYAFLAHLLHGATFNAASSVGQDGIYALSFETSSQPLAIVWNTGPATQTVWVPWPASTAVAMTPGGDILGNAPVVAGKVSWPAAPDGQPIYLLARPPTSSIPSFLALPTSTPSRAVRFIHLTPVRPPTPGGSVPRDTKTPIPPTRSLPTRAVPTNAMPASTPTAPPALTSPVSQTPAAIPVVTVPSRTPAAIPVVTIPSRTPPTLAPSPRPALEATTKPLPTSWPAHPTAAATATPPVIPTPDPTPSPSPTAGMAPGAIS